MMKSHIDGFKELIAKFDNDDDFFLFFNNSTSLWQADINAAWDFSYNFATPLANVLEKSMENSTALEIGCGGGRLLAHAARHFRHVVGIDIHDSLQIVNNYFLRNGISNTKLLQTDGISIPCESNMFDVIYSFIVFQHLEHIEIIKKYLLESYRCLKNNGYFIFYFGRLCKFSRNTSSKFLLLCDILNERLALPSGYMEFPAPINSTNIYVTLPYMAALCKNAGFHVIKRLVSRRNIPIGTKKFGGQWGLIVQKRES